MPSTDNLRIKDNSTEKLLDLSINSIGRATVVTLTHVKIDYIDGTTGTHDIGLDGMRRMSNWMRDHDQVLRNAPVTLRPIQEVPAQPIHRLERITRAAARTIGRDVTGYVWRDDVQGLALATPGRAAPWPTFAPLADPCDAFVLEAKLHLNVNYRCNGKSVGVYVSCNKHADLGYMSTVPPDRDAGIKARMFAVTQFAELYLMAEDGDG